MDEVMNEVNKYLVRGKYHGLHAINECNQNKKKDKYVVEQKSANVIVGRKYDKVGLEVYGSERKLDLKKLTKKDNPTVEDVVNVIKNTFGKKCLITASAIKTIERLYRN